MTYLKKDRSVDDGAPVEFYKIVGPFGTIRLTTDNTPGILGGEIYNPLPGSISRSAIELSAVTDSTVTVDVIIPSDSEVAKLCCYKSSPDFLTVTILSAHRGDDWSTDFRVEWVGYGLSTSVSGDYATIKTGTAIQTLLGGNLGTVYYQRSCNHALFDERCKINKADWTITSTVTYIEGSMVRVVNDQAADHELRGGEIYIARTGEIRAIQDNVDNLIYVSYPFFDIELGEELEITYGCDHLRLGHCKQRFNNVANYGGMDWIPVDNPFADFAKEAIVTETLKTERARHVRVRSYTMETK